MKKLSKITSSLYSGALVFLVDQLLPSSSLEMLYGPMQPPTNNNWVGVLLFFALPIFILLIITIALVFGIVKLLKKKPSNVKKNR